MKEDIGGINMDLRNHPLKEQNDLIKEVYISTLFACASSDGEINKIEYEFIKNICDVVGCDPKYCLERMYRDFNKYVESFKLDFTNNNIIYSFIADAFYLGYLDDDLNQKEISFISKLAQIASLDKKIFEYFYYISELAIRDNENNYNYIVAILAKPREVEFKLFKHLFKKYDKSKTLNNKYVKKVLKERDELINYRNLCLEFIKKDHSLEEVGEFTGETLQPVDDICSRLDQLARDIKKETGESLVITDDDVEWDLVSDLSDLNQTVTNLLVEVGMVVLMGEKQNFNIKERLKEIIEKFNSVISYLNDIENNL